MRKLVALSGYVAAGKSTFASALGTRHSVKKVSTRQYILNHTETTEERGALQAAGDDLDRTTGGAWVADAVAEQTAGVPEGTILLIDSVRIDAQVVELRRRFGKDSVLHVHLTAPEGVLERRYLSRPAAVREFATYPEVRQSSTEAAVGELERIADVVVDTSRMTPDSQVAYAVEGYVTQPANRQKLVDVYVGAQWGSEGKGNICAYVAKEYGVLVRVGGPNAGHRVADPPYKYVQLPSGTGTNPYARILIAAGSTIWLPTILKEIDDHPWLKNKGNLVIDSRAMIIDELDREVESQLLESIASTKQGVGAAAARKIIGRGGKPPFGPPVTLAASVPELEPYIGDTKEELDRAYAEGKMVMLEGTQGTHLSIHHGFYPKVTSRETSSSGCLSDAGISPARVREVVLVTRCYPIRVGGDSGPMGLVITFDEIATRSGLNVADIERTEVGTVSGRTRRIAEFDWEQLRQSVEINGATQIAITFADYLDCQNRSATDFASLSASTREFIQNVERVAGCRVTFVSKGVGRAGVIDRRRG